MGGKPCNLTHVARAGRYFVWRLLRLTGLHDSRGTKNQNLTVELGRTVHADLLFWEVVDRPLATTRMREALSFPSYTPRKTTREKALFIWRQF